MAGDHGLLGGGWLTAAEPLLKNREPCATADPFCWLISTLFVGMLVGIDVNMLLDEMA